MGINRDGLMGVIQRFINRLFGRKEQKRMSAMTETTEEAMEEEVMEEEEAAEEEVEEVEEEIAEEVSAGQALVNAVNAFEAALNARVQLMNDVESQARSVVTAESRAEQAMQDAETAKGLETVAQGAANDQKLEIRAAGNTLKDSVDQIVDAL